MHKALADICTIENGWDPGEGHAEHSGGSITLSGLLQRTTPIAAGSWEKVLTFDNSDWPLPPNARVGVQCSIWGDGAAYPADVQIINDGDGLWLWNGPDEIPDTVHLYLTGLTWRV